MTDTLTKTEQQQPQRTATRGNGETRPQFLTPLANIVETPDGYLLEAEMPGVSKEGLTITVENGEIVIHGRRSETTATGEALYRESRPWDFRRVFELDPSIDVGRVSAKIESGVLRLTLPKAESVKPRKIEVSA